MLIVSQVVGMINTYLSNISQDWAIVLRRIIYSEHSYRLGQAPKMSGY